jgi:uncharacterized membrane protein
MNLEWISLRILHIVAGTFWVGTDVFATFLLILQLRALGPAVEHAVMGALMRYLPPVMTISALTTAITGVWMAVTLQGWNPAWMLANGWGISMLIGFVGTAAALVIGLGMVPPVTIRYDRLSRCRPEDVRVREPRSDHHIRSVAAGATKATFKSHT